MLLLLHTIKVPVQPKGMNSCSPVTECSVELITCVPLSELLKFELADNDQFFKSPNPNAQTVMNKRIRILTTTSIAENLVEQATPSPTTRDMKRIMTTARISGKLYQH